MGRDIKSLCLKGFVYVFRPPCLRHVPSLVVIRLKFKKYFYGHKKSGNLLKNDEVIRQWVMDHKVLTKNALVDIKLSPQYNSVLLSEMTI